MAKSTHWILFCALVLGLKMAWLRSKPQTSDSILSLDKVTQGRHQSLRQRFTNPEHADFIISTTLGEKRWLNPKTRKLHRQFNLTHLFTPSGLHFSALMLLVRFFVRSRWLKICLYLAPLTLGGLHSCKRVGLLFGVREFFPKISLYALFLGVMALDYAFGTYRQSPASFLYSFIFLGVFITMGASTQLRVFLNLICANIIISYVFQTPLAPWGVFWGLLLTPLFSLFFPLLFLNLILPFLAPLSHFILTAWFYVLEKIPAPEFYFTASLPLLLALFLRRKIHPLLLALLLLIHTEALANEKKCLFCGSERALPLSAVSRMTRAKSGYTVDSMKWGLRCRSVLSESEWRVRCSDLPAWKKKMRLVRK